MTGPAITSILDSVLTRRERFELIRRDALSDFRGAIGPALVELMAREVTRSTLDRYNSRHAKATAKYRNATAAECEASQADLATTQLGTSASEYVKRGK